MKIKKEMKSLDKKIDELLHHMADMQIDLDDGVKVNYEKFDGGSGENIE